MVSYEKRALCGGSEGQSKVLFHKRVDSFKKESSMKPSSVFIQYSMEYSVLSMRILRNNGNYGDKSIVNTEYRV
jgi:hypothetical protein